MCIEIIQLKKNCVKILESYKEQRIREHHCHAKGCKTPCKPEYLMCYKHWKMVAPHIQKAVWRYYRPGQCEDMQVSFEWLEAAEAAVACVAVQEDKICNNDQIKAGLNYGVRFS